MEKDEDRWIYDRQDNESFNRGNYTRRNNHSNNDEGNYRFNKFWNNDRRFNGNNRDNNKGYREAVIERYYLETTLNAVETIKEHTNKHWLTSKNNNLARIPMDDILRFISNFRRNKTHLEERIIEEDMTAVQTQPPATLQQHAPNMDIGN
ncbi:hypothetical protein HELRODRAFT_177553 [Helobdella robusta]|uniref:Uncharacterized protein n=1 Tax=Helobdella robusta TaxID=6412 RepID=T1FBV5_HELRO|nr:hypothetical protein HELRODRAFT_177553 [Helobdella robusta]ESN97901.1 hypothetical protein HELRODRAFT_177553 [Helobdella robusta]